MTSFPPARIFQHDRLENMLQAVPMVVVDTIQEDNNAFKIPEPDPIRPDRAIEVVPSLPLSHIDHWKQLVDFKKMFCTSKDETICCYLSLEPLPVHSSYDVGGESFNIHVLHEYTNVRSGGCSDAETVSSGTMSLSSSNRSCQSVVTGSKPLSPRKKEVNPTRQIFQENQWEDKFHELTVFLQKHGHHNVPQDGSNQQVSETSQ
jgi:hypothetical protein